MFNKFADAAKSLKEKANVSAKLEDAKQFASEKYEAGKAEVNAAWDKHWPTVQNLLVEGLLSIAEEKLRDDSVLEAVFGKLYETLPIAARLALSRDRFIAFAMLQRGPLLSKVRDARALRQTPASKPQHLD